MMIRSFALAAALLVAPAHAEMLAAMPSAVGIANATTNEQRLNYPPDWPPLRISGRLRTLKDVNRRVNNLPLSDCKAFAFEKQRRLLNLGIDAMFVSVKTETGQYHAIAVVDGIWALDSRFAGLITVNRLREFGYSIAPLPGEEGR